jgi:hypothetical protein
MQTMEQGTGQLVIRWTAGVAAILATRLLLEHQLPGGAAMGLGLGLFVMLWIPTVPVDAYRYGSPLRRVLYMRMAFFLLAAVVAGVAYETLAGIAR